MLTIKFSEIRCHSNHAIWLRPHCTLLSLHLILILILRNKKILISNLSKRAYFEINVSWLLFQLALRKLYFIIKLKDISIKLRHFLKIIIKPIPYLTIFNIRLKTFLRYNENVNSALMVLLEIHGQSSLTTANKIFVLEIKSGYLIE